MRLGYNTNGLAHHDPLDAVRLLAELGYQSVALTLDHGRLDPFDDRFPDELQRTAAELRRLDLRCTVETGARFLLDPRVKHEPTLMTADPAGRERRIDFLCRAIDAAERLGADCVSLWSGVLRDAAPRPAALDRLVAALAPVLEHAERRGVDVGFEPEPGMFVDTMERFDELAARIDSPRFRLTLDVGHLHCLGERPLEAYVRRYADRLVNVHLEDMRAGEHEHLEFGRGEIDFPPLIESFAEVGYRGGLHVELSRHSHDGPAAARRARQFLEPLVRRAMRLA